MSGQENLAPSFEVFEVLELINSWFNFEFWVSGTRLSRRFDSNLTKAFYPSLQCQVSYPIKALDFWPLISIEIMLQLKNICSCERTHPQHCSQSSPLTCLFIPLTTTRIEAAPSSPRCLFHHCRGRPLKSVRDRWKWWVLEGTLLPFVAVRLGYIVPLPRCGHSDFLVDSL